MAGTRGGHHPGRPAPGGHTPHLGRTPPDRCTTRVGYDSGVVVPWQDPKAVAKAVLTLRDDVAERRA
ncbi:hypothetical protein AB0L05_31320, partial [Nonomuraea pusilla]